MWRGQSGITGFGLGGSSGTKFALVNAARIVSLTGRFMEKTAKKQFVAPVLTAGASLAEVTLLSIGGIGIDIHL